MNDIDCLSDLLSRYSQRADKKRYFIDDDWFFGEEQIQHLDMDEALKSLNQRELEILVKRFVHGMTYRQISKSLSSPVCAMRVLNLQNASLRKLCEKK